IDRWILSELQELITTARKSFEAYNVMAFCLEAERFVDDRLSNWYIRRNRGRFQSNVADLDEAGRHDKWAAHQTLHTVLTTLCKLFAPVVPFLSEMIWQNLRTDGDPKSIHLCDYPERDEALRDPKLSSMMNGLLRLVREAMNLRNQSKQKVRQPLAALIVQPGNNRERQALDRFTDQLREEVNVKAVVTHYREGEGRDLLESVRKNNHNAIRQLWPDRAKEIIAKLEAGMTIELPSADGGPPDLAIDLPDVRIVLPFAAVYEWRGPEGWLPWADTRGQLQMLLDTRISPQLKAEGYARDVIRHVQEQRKESGLNMEDRIELYIGTDSERLRDAIDAHRDHIAAETLTIRWAGAPNGEVHEVKIEGQVLKIALRKVG
ncbi:MAG TPA: class I tRNA ligase family protein, partial [Gemmataceae bacterium]|nr:class I tRNA ligase family protein [Gemmataceae bacterium]